MSDAENVETGSLLRQRTVPARFAELALRSENLDEILTEACRLVREALGTDLAKVVELQDDGETLRVRAGVGWKPGVVGVATITAADDTLEGLTLRTGEPMISPDIETETRFRYPPFLIEHGVRAVANVLIIGGKNRPPFGLLQVDSREPRRFTADDTAFLSGYANLLAAAVNRLHIIADLHAKEAQLRQAQRLETIGRLAAGVAHDFNNILQGVSGGLELVLDDVEPGTPAHDFATVALGAVGRGADLIHHLLSYARKQILHPTQIDVAAFLSTLQRLLSRKLGQHIAITIRTDLALPRIHVDAGQLQTAVLSLAINGAQAMPRGGTLSLDAQVDRDDMAYVIIAVTDTGVGMDAATAAQAFEPFFTTKGPDGSGLGLSMVQGFAEQSGGKVRIESAPGKGTRVELRLPVAGPADRSDGKQSTPAKLRGTGRILLVDDIADVLLTTGAFLERAGFQVVRAGSGRQALDLLTLGEPFDVLVSDYSMPGMTGAELVERARAIQPRLAALVVTGLAGAGDIDTPPPAVAVLRKPFQRWQLIDAVLRVTGQQSGSSANGMAPGTTQNGL